MNKFKSFINIFLLFSFTPLLLHSQEYSYMHYTVQDGLVQSQVWPMFQDSKGYIWAGTKGGISRFDGISFLNYSHFDGLPGNFIHLITEDSQGVVWFLTIDGLAKFDGRNLTGYPTDHFRNSYGFMMFQETAPGRLLIIHTSVKNEMIFTEFRQGQYTDIPSPFPSHISDEANSQVSFTSFDPSDNSYLYASNTSGLLRIRGQDVDTLFNNINKFQDLEFGCDGNLYLVANDTVFRIEDSDAQGVVNLKPDFGNASIMNFKIDHDGRVFFIDPKNQLVICDDEVMITENFDFPVINTMLIDRENNVWLGTESGLYRLITRAFVNFIPGRCGIQKLIWSISEDRSGKIWFASYSDGLKYYDGEQFTAEESYFSIAKGALYYFHMGSIIDHNGNVLFPVNNMGGIKYDGQRFTGVFPKQVTLATFIFFEDPENFDLLAGTNLGLYIISPDQDVEVLDIKPGNGKNKIVVSIIKDKLDRYWLGGFNGISLLDGKQVIHLPTVDLPFESGGNCMITDYRENIWIGNANGLYCYDFQTFERVAHEGLNSMVTSLALIGDTAMLVGSVTGLALLDLDEYYSGKHVDLVVFGKEDGFQGIEPGQNAIFRDSRGLYWIACSDRVVSFDPELYQKNTSPPSVFITSASLLNDKMDWITVDETRLIGEEFHFNHNEKNLRFEFAGISTTAPGKVRYSYFLEGYDKGWSEPENDRYAVYTNLPPGNYRLLLKACNGNGYWVTEPANFRFRIIPAFYQRSAFWVISFIITAGLLVLLGSILSNQRKKNLRLKLETEKKMAQLQLLNLKNQIDPHFTYNAINSIASVVLKEDKEQAYKFFVKFSNLIRGIMRSSEQLTRSLDEEISFVRDYLEIEKFRYKEKFDYEIRTTADVDLRRQIPKMTIQTFAENALKHGLLHLDGKGILRISVLQEPGMIRIEIEDNGIGREKSAQYASTSTGKGLGILRGYFDYFNLYHHEKSDFYIEDKKDENGEACGTRITVLIPDTMNYTA